MLDLVKNSTQPTITAAAPAVTLADVTVTFRLADGGSYPAV